MYEILRLLLNQLKYQVEVIRILLILLTGKVFQPKPEKITDKKYQKLSVYPIPTFGNPKIQQACSTQPCWSGITLTTTTICGL